MKKPLYLALVLTILIYPSTALAKGVRSANTEVELVPEVNAIRPGDPFWIGVRMTMDNHWHTYWKYPGDSGLATRIDWELPPGFKAGELQWPYPTRLNEAGLTTYGYEDEVYLLTEIDAPRNLPDGENIQLKARVSFLACEKVCIPGEAVLTHTLPVSTTGGAWADVFTPTRERIPIENSSWNITAKASGDDIKLLISPAGGSLYKLGAVEFFPDESLQIQHAADQVLTPIDNGYILQLKKSEFTEKLPKKISGVLVSQNGWRGFNSEKAWQIERPLQEVSAQRFGQLGEGLPAVKTVPLTSDLNVWAAILFAFIGGLILNLMPCVLPVLSLKVLSLVEHKDDKSLAWTNGLVFALGVLVSFWILAGVLLALRAAGSQIGWGFQFQSPKFVVMLAGLFFIFALNLFGVFEIGLSLTRVEGAIDKGKGHKNSFLTGMLATVAATPCTAPFMGAALGFALSQSALVSLLIFSFLGIGMAFPYLVLARFPQLLKFVPKPGAWMISLKRFMGVLLLVTSVWLLWILHLLTGANALVAVTVGFFITGVGCWIYGRSQSAPSKTFQILLAMLCLLAGLSVGLWGTELNGTVAHKKTKTFHPGGGIRWLDFTPDLVERLRDKGKPVFIDFTAAWCLSCQVNERVVFQDEQVINTFKELGVVAVKADWTKRDDMITRALAGYGKSSIPLYVYYRSGASKPIILPEIITPSIVMNILEKK